MSGALASPSQTASLTVVAAVHPSEATLRVKLSHTLPTLRAIPPEALLSVQLGWVAGHRLGLELQAGACELQGGGELRLDHGLHWWVLAESSCEALQVRGAAAWVRGRPHALQGAGRGLLFNHWRNKRDETPEEGTHQILIKPTLCPGNTAMNQAEVNACLGETGNPRHPSAKCRLYRLVGRTTARQKVGAGA